MVQMAPDFVGICVQPTNEHKIFKLKIPQLSGFQPVFTRFSVGRVYIAVPVRLSALIIVQYTQFFPLRQCAGGDRAKACPICCFIFLYSAVDNHG